MDYKDLEEKAKLIRKWCLISTTEAGSGHPTTCLSAVDLMTVLFDKYYSYDLKDPQNVNNDRLIFSKGHAAPLLYTLYALSGAFSLEHLKTLRKIDSDLEGHPTPNFKFAEAATGSLGQGLSIGAGEAYALSAHVQKIQSFPKVFVLLGDGEMAEGSIWEAANFASFYKLNNLIAILDVNRLGQSQETMFGYKTTEYEKRFTAFGFETITINGHDFEEIQAAFKSAVNNKNEKPIAIIAKTVKGKGISFLENKEGWHGKALNSEDLNKALHELGNTENNLRFDLSLNQGHVKNTFPASARSNLNLTTQSSDDLRVVGSPPAYPISALINYKKGDQIATREVYGEILAELGEFNKNIYALDGDVKNSTYSEKFKDKFPDRFIECFIAEQNMVGVACGLAKLGKKPFVSTFGAFLTRAFDQIRMANIGQANIAFCGSHGGVSIGEDGPSQMALEDMAMFSSMPDSVIFHPSDAVSTLKLMPIIVNFNGISYLRTLRPKTRVLYAHDEEFKIGGSKTLHETKNDLLTVAACGITVHEALKAYDELKKENIFIRVVDCYSVKPIDKENLLRCIDETRQKIIITVEDHFEHGGFGDLVLSALALENVKILKMAVKKISRSGKQDELLRSSMIDWTAIVRNVKKFL